MNFLIEIHPPLGIGSVHNCLSTFSRTYIYPDLVHVAVVACGDRQPETTVAVKTILLTVTAPVFFHIFTEDDLKSAFTFEVSSPA